jgi:flagellar hook-length control protein FliK
MPREAGTPDAMTQLRDLLNRTLKQGEPNQRDVQPFTPAGARTVELETSLRVEQMTGQPPTSEIQTASRGSAAPMPSAQLTVVKMDGGDAAIPVRNAADESLFSERIVRGLSAMVNQRGGVMNMKLHPAELGSLRVQMSIVQGSVTAQFVASTVEAQMMLDRSMGTLRAALESHGLHVERISVTHASSDSSGTSMRQDGQDQQNQQSTGRHHDAGQGQSRGRHDEWRQGGHPPREHKPSDFAGQFHSYEATLGGGDQAEPGVET